MPRWLCSFWLLVLVTVPVHGQTSALFDHLSVTDGLSQRSVTALAQDSAGYLWVGTEDGLNRYDGHRFVVYRHVLGDSASVPSSRITALYTDRTGRLWVGTQGGLAWLHRESESFRRVQEGPAPGSPCGTNVSDFAEDRLGQLWVGARDGGLCWFDRDAGRFREAVFDQPAQRRTPIGSFDRMLSGDVRLNWYRSFEAPRGCSIHPERRQVSCADDSQSVNWRSEDGAFLIGRPARRVPIRLYQVKGGEWIPIAVDFDLVGLRQTALQDRETVWLAAETEGVYTVDLETGTSRRFEMGGASLPGTLARIVFKDKAGDVWIGTNQGLSRWKGQRSIGFGLFEEKDGLASRFVNGMTTDGAGNVWVATLDGLTRWRPDTGQTRTYDRQGGGRYPNAFWTVLEDETGTIWVGSKRQGLFTLDPASGEFERSPLIRQAVGDALWPILAIRHLSQDSAGRLWAGTSSGLYVQHARGEMFERVAQDELPSLAVNTVYEDYQGQHWAGTDEGLCQFRPSSAPVRCFAKGDSGLTGSIVWTITEDATDPGALWFGTIGGGLCRMETSEEQFECYTTAEGLPNMTVYGVRSDDAGSLWLSTNEGLAQFDIEARWFRVYTATDGLQGNAFDFMAHHRGEDGRFYFGGPNGVTWFHPSQLDFSDLPASARVSRLQVYDQYRTGLLASGDTVSLNYDENFFAFELTALDFSNPEQNQYRYRLAGYDDEWRSTTGQQPRAAYTGVPPGAYRFEVAEVNRDGVAGPLAVVVTNVRPAFWQTGWFRWGGGGLLVVLALAGGVLVYRRREEAWARQRAEEREMQRRLSESRERERERIARELHDGPMQELYSLGHVFELASLKHSFDPAASGEMRGHIDTVASELRAILKALRPVHLRHLGLVTGLKTLVFQFCERHPEVTVLIELPEEPVELDGETELALYRIAQEGLNNVGRHANATRVDLTFRVGDGAATLEIRDDGQGFEMPAKAIDLARAGHFGVLGTMERADMHGGRVDLKSSPGEGTWLHVWMPI